MQHEAALASFRRVVGLGWLLASVQCGGPAPLGPRAFKPFPVSALVREGDLRLCTTGYAGKPRQLLLLMMRCSGAEVRAAAALAAAAAALHGRLSVCCCCGSGGGCGTARAPSWVLPQPTPVL